MTIKAELAVKRGRRGSDWREVTSTEGRSSLFSLEVCKEGRQSMMVGLNQTHDASGHAFGRIRK